MKTKFHIEVTRKALEDQFSEQALKKIIFANIKQDRIAYLIGHDHIHFDGSAFKQGFEYISTQEELVYKHIELSDFDRAREAFGRMLHSWQDFFSHSNYIDLWLNIHQNYPPEEILSDDPKIINHPNLKSGKNYGLMEFIVMIPGLSHLFKPLMPVDSHARMNLDSPSCGPFFAYVYSAAFKRTQKTYDQIIHQLIKMNASQDVIILFKDQQKSKKRYNHHYD